MYASRLPRVRPSEFPGRSSRGPAPQPDSQLTLRWNYESLPQPCPRCVGLAAAVKHDSQTPEKFHYQDLLESNTSAQFSAADCARKKFPCAGAATLPQSPESWAPSRRREAQPRSMQTAAAEIPRSLYRPVQSGKFLGARDKLMPESVPD